MTAKHLYCHQLFRAICITYLSIFNIYELAFAAFAKIAMAEVDKLHD